MPMTRAAGVLVVLAIAAASVLLGAPAAVARQDQAGQELAPVMLVLDASGSMTGADPSGATKMDAAKAAVRALVQQAPANAQLGLTVYGTGTGNSDAEKAAGCRDVKVAHPLGALDREGIAQAADRIQPRGYTPIGRSLQVAADALPPQGPRSIVLVSDGIDTCAPPDPCEIARQLAGQGVAFTVHVVGFDLDEQARQQMTCVAEATGGTYTDASDADQLGRALNQATTAALRSYQAAGTPIQGGTDQAGAPTVGPGAYLDRQVEPAGVRYYTVDVPAGFTFYATATTVFGPGTYSEQIKASIYAQDGSECRFENDLRNNLDPHLSLAFRHTVPQGATDGGDPCERPGPYTLRVERSKSDGEFGPADLELLFGLEPPLAGQPPSPPADQAVAFTPPSGEPVAVTGGGSFSTAATLEGSGRYTDTVLFGEAVFYRVRLEWGQALAYTVQFADGTDPAASNVQSAWYDVQRVRRGWDHDVYNGAALKLPEGSDAFASAPVRYANRDTRDAFAMSVAGWYYISVRNGEYGDTERDRQPTPVTINLAVAGQPEPPPPYAASGGGSTDAFGGRDLGAATATPAPTPDAGAAEDETTGNDSGLLGLAGRGPVLWGGIAAAVLVAAVLLVTVARRRTG